MKRIWLGLGVLAALLVVGIWSMLRTDAVHTAMAEQLRQAARETDAHAAYAAGELVQRQWQEHRGLTGSTADHTQIDEIDSLFAQLEICRLRQDRDTHALLCAALSESIAALAEGHRLSWWNLL